MCTPYETRDTWEMAATLHNGTIYISEIETEENREKRENMDEKHKEMCYWGYNFESYVTSLVDKNRHCKNGAVAKTEGCANNDSEAFITVIRTRLGKHSLVFGAEVDCCAKVCFSYIPVVRALISDHLRNRKSGCNLRWLLTRMSSCKQLHGKTIEGGRS